MENLRDKTPRPFRFIGGRLCLDFTNTVGGRDGSNVLKDKLRACEDLVAWCQQAGVLSKAEAVKASRAARSSPPDAARMLQRSILLRENLYRLLFAHLKKHKITAADVETLNRELKKIHAQRRLRPGRDAFAWEWDKAGAMLESPLREILLSAEQVLTSPQDLDLLRQCEGEQCGWLFIDTSRNHSRLWCRMKDCGNLAKVHRYRSRHAS